MTREEAIKHLGYVRDNNIPISSDTFDALTMAIKALEVEPCEDGKGCSNCIYSGRPTYKSPCSECRDNSQWEMKQPEPCEDTISRQAAIEAIDRYYKDKRYITRSRTILSAICRDMKSTMDSLPSAEPRITRCAECIHWKHSAARKSYCEVFDWMSETEDFCSFAERRDDE